MINFLKKYLKLTIKHFLNIFVYISISTSIFTILVVLALFVIIVTDSIVHLIQILKNFLI